MNKASFLLTSLAALLLSLPLPASEIQTPDITPQNEHPFFRTSLYPAWSRMTPEQALIDARKALEEADARLSRLAAIPPEHATFENTFLAWYESQENIKQVTNYIYHLHTAHGAEDMKRTMGQIAREVAVFKARNPYTPRIAQVLQEAARQPWVQELSPARQRFITQTINSMRQEGLYLDAAGQARKAAIERELSQLSFAFSYALNNYRQVWQRIITDPAELAGMPASWMEVASGRGALKTPEGKPAWLINLTSVPAAPVLRYCTVEETRRLCWLGTTSAGTARAYDTEPLVVRILELRHELATLLGYAHYADMQTSQRMMGNGATALAFVNEMLEKSKPAWDAHVRAELKRYSEASGQELSAVAPWNIPFLDHKRPPQRQSFDSNSITPYLQAPKVIQGMLDIWSELLGLRIEELPTVCPRPGETDHIHGSQVETWHPDVRCFAVHDGASGRHLGSFYLDIYARQGKRPSAWSLPLRDGQPGTNGSPGEPHLATLMANFTPPQASRPHLLHHGEVYQLFHEFGHIMHMLLGHGELRAHCTAEIERDFIEMPSQLAESWVWEPQALARFTSHHTTGEPLPQDLARQLAASRGSNPIAMHIRMLCMSKLDLELHMHYHDRYKGRPIDEVTQEILRPWLFPYTEQPPSELRTLSHIMVDGYAAALYTYKWSEMMAADALERFHEAGLDNADLGAAYRKAILDCGSSAPAMQLIKNFLGRPPNADALIRRYKEAADSGTRKAE